jgi:hypothetical protein
MDEGQRYDRRTALGGALAAAGGAALAAGLPAAAIARTPGHGGSKGGHPAGVGLRGRGIGYDVGDLVPASPSVTATTRSSFDPHEVKREMRVIRDVLNASAVRLEGSAQDRLEIAATLAAEAGLEVWYSPWPANQNAEQMLAFLADSAERCERLRRRGHDIVLTTGSELFITMQGFIPGDYYLDRVEFLKNREPGFAQAIVQLPGKINAFLASAVPVVRARFGGPISYAAISIERVDWTPFDYVSEDFFPPLVNGEYVGAIATIESLRSHGKPVAITELACGTYQGAAANPLGADEIREYDANGVPIGIKPGYVRDEAEQAGYLSGLLRLFDEDGVDTAFVFDLVQTQLPGELLDTASWGIARMLEPGANNGFQGLPWVPKEAFWVVADLYAQCRGRR